MDLSDRIARRRETSNGGLIVDESALNPAVHLSEVVGRGPVLEQLLDALDPVFDGQRPDDVAVVGPSGSGKSAVVTALFSRLNECFDRSADSIQTTTRGGTGTPEAEFAYVDGRRVASEFQFYHAILDALSSDPVPRRGVGTGELRDRMESIVADEDRCVVVGIDHFVAADAVGDADDPIVPLEVPTPTVVVSEATPDGWGAETVEVPAYRAHALVDLLTERASIGLTSGSLSYDHAQQIANWADGDAHDALAALFGAAISARRDDATRIRDADVEVGVAAVPDDCAQIGRVLSLPENRRAVLAELLAIDADDQTTIGEAATLVGDRTDLSSSTVQRFLYELAEDDVLERRTVDAGDAHGRTPTRVVPRFPTLVFERLATRTER